MNSQAMTEPIQERVILWQDHSHPEGYRPTLTLLVFPNGRKCLELSVHGTVMRLPYTSAETPEHRDLGASPAIGASYAFTFESTSGDTYSNVADVVFGKDGLAPKWPNR